MPDADLLNAIRADLAASPFIGEGHRKVWARLRILRDIRVSRTRVLRLMRENALLSPHRRPQGKSSLHDGTITTSRPNEMWGTDGVRIETVDDGWVWVFSAVDHCDACCVGIHAVKTGNRFAALQPIAQGLLGEFGGTGAEVGRGLTLRMDTVRSTRPMTSSTRSGSGASRRASPSSPNRKRMASLSASTGR
jgi:transposase InsO family protein|nr:IS3 family transposase [Caballeronia arationis]